MKAPNDILLTLKDHYAAKDTDAWMSCLEAAAEIERLRAALEEMVNEAAKYHAENVSRAELGGSEMARRKAKAIVSRSGVFLYKIKYIARRTRRVYLEGSYC